MVEAVNMHEKTNFIYHTEAFDSVAEVERVFDILKEEGTVLEE